MRTVRRQRQRLISRLQRISSPSPLLVYTISWPFNCVWMCAKSYPTYHINASHEARNVNINSLGLITRWLFFFLFGSERGMGRKGIHSIRGLLCSCQRTPCSHSGLFSITWKYTMLIFLQLHWAPPQKEKQDKKEQQLLSIRVYIRQRTPVECLNVPLSLTIT